MDIISINYNFSQTRKSLSIIIGSYILLYTGYHVISLIFSKLYNLEFFISILGVFLGIILILKVTLFSSKPIFELDENTLYSRAGTKKNTYRISWDKIKNMSIGISYLKITENGNKEKEIDLSELKYSDLRKIKACIIDICEEKVIPYQNN